MVICAARSYVRSVDQWRLAREPHRSRIRLYLHRQGDGAFPLIPPDARAS
jgi:hypothetical protein